MIIQLPVLPMPYSSPICPPLDRAQQVKLKKALRERGNCCFWCGHQFGKTAKVTIDHVIPRSRGGAETLDNLVLCCSRCNLLKEDLFPSEWLARLEAVTKRIREVLPMVG